MTFPVLVHNWRAVPDTQGDGTGGPGGGTGPGDGPIDPGTDPVDPLIQDWLGLWPHDIFYTMDDAQPLVSGGIVNENVFATRALNVAATFSEHATSLIDTDGSGNVMVCSNVDTAEMRFSSDYGQNFSVVSAPDISGLTLSGGNSGITCLRYSQQGGYWAVSAVSDNTQFVIWVSDNDGASWTKLDNFKSGVSFYATTFSWGFGFDSLGGIIAAVMGQSNSLFLIKWSDPTSNASPDVSARLTGALNFYNSAWQIGSKYFFWGEGGELASSNTDLSDARPSASVSSSSLVPPRSQAFSWNHYPAISSNLVLSAVSEGANTSQQYYALNGSETVDADGTVPTSASSTITIDFSEAVRAASAAYDAQKNLWFVSGFTESKTNELIIKTSSSATAWPTEEQKVVLSNPDRPTGYAVGNAYSGYFCNLVPLGNGSFIACYLGSDNTELTLDKFSLASASQGVVSSGGNGVASIDDKGTEQYPNSVVGAPLFEQPALVADNGTSVEFTANGSVVTTGVTADQHMHTFILDLTNANGTFFDNGDITLSFDGATIFVNGNDTSLGPDTRYVVVMQDGNTVTSYANNSTVPITTETITPSATVTQELQGDGVVLDWYILDDIATTSLADLIGALEDQFPSVPAYDPSVGLSPTDVTPAPGGNVISPSQPTSQLAPQAWHIRDDGFGMFFVNGSPNLKYVTDDFGETWTGPIDQSGDLQPRSGISGGDPTVVGQLAYGGGSNYAIILAYQGNRTSDVAYSTNSGASWTRINSGFYAWGVDMQGSDILHTLRNSSSGGVGVTNYYSTGGAGATVNITGGIDNGGGAIIAADQSWAMSLYQNPANAKRRSAYTTPYNPPSIPVWDDLNPNPATVVSTQYAKIPGSPLVFNSTQRFTGDSSPESMPITQLDHLETVQSNFRAGVAGYKSSTSTIIRSWSFNDGDNNNNSKIHMELNEGTTTGGWGNKFHINLPESHNHSTYGVRDRIVGAGPYWFYSFVGDSTRSVRLLRFEFPIQSDLEIPDIAQPTTGRVAYRIGADAPSFLATTDEFGESRFDIGNDIPVSPTFDVVGSIPSNHSTIEPKFGAGHLSIPGHAGTTFYRPLTVPYWNGREEIGLQDFTFDCWVKPTAVNERAYIFSSQAIGVNAGQVFRWGGMTVFARGSGTNGYIQVYIGKSEADASAEIDNDLRYGSALALFGSWQQDAAVWRPNDYNFISICRRNGRWALYLNGRSAVALNSAPVDPGTLGPTDAYIHAGGDTLFGAYLRPYSSNEYALYGDACYIDDARLIVGECIHKTPIFNVPNGPLTV